MLHMSQVCQFPVNSLFIDADLKHVTITTPLIISAVGGSQSLVLKLRLVYADDK